jgi:hypothetical protein
VRIGNVCRIGPFPGPVGGKGFGFLRVCGRPLDSVTKISVRCAMTPVADLRDFVRRHPAGCYFILTFAIS